MVKRRRKEVRVLLPPAPAARSRAPLPGIGTAGPPSEALVLVGVVGRVARVNTACHPPLPWLSPGDVIGYY